MPRDCQHCAAPIALSVRAGAKYCCKSCREMASRRRSRERAAQTPKALPRELTRLARWVRRGANKTPLRAIGGAPARANDPETWTTYENARDSRIGTGLGFVLSGDGIVCVDLDHALVDGVPTPAVAAWLRTLPPTYIEISPSGNGLHVWGRGLVLTARKIKAAGIAGEVIGARKYATVTGNRWRDAPLTLANIARQARPLIR